MKNRRPGCAARPAAFLLCLLLLLPLSAPAEWLTPEEALARDDAWLVAEKTGTVTLTFLGDCTLGGERTTAGSSRGYRKTVEKKGAEWPLGGVLRWTAADDVTLVNLEGVLTDRDLPAAQKEFTFRGPSSLTAVLTAGSAECVTLSNNHTLDYGERGLADTRAALERAGVAAVSFDTPLIWREGDFQAGFTASSGGLSEGAADLLREQIRMLRLAGCDIIVHSMHGGEEYQSAPTPRQRETARIAAEAGADLVIGHHPHIVQGWEEIAGVPVFYSLGNASFGGNTDPRDYDALLLQAEWRFSGGEREGLTLRLVPLSVSSTPARNDFRPTPLSGADAARVLDKMRRSAPGPVPDWDEASGAAVIEFGKE